MGSCGLTTGMTGARTASAAPVSVFGDEFVRVRPDNTRVVHPQRVEANAVLGILLPPTILGDHAHRLQRVLMALSVISFDQKSRHSRGFGQAPIGRLENCPQHPFGGHRMRAEELREALAEQRARRGRKSTKAVWVVRPCRARRSNQPAPGSFRSLRRTDSTFSTSATTCPSSPMT